MTVIFDAEPLVAFAFDEPGSRAVEAVLADIYDGEIDGYVPTVDLAEFRYVASRRTSGEAADAHIDDLREMGVAEYDVDGLWRTASKLKASYAPSLGDAYAVAAAKAEDERGRDVTLLVGADDDYDVFEEETEFAHLIERFRDDHA
jgi:predicted nucleic acid-binding protein